MRGSVIISRTAGGKAGRKNAGSVGLERSERVLGGMKRRFGFGRW